MRQTIIMFAAMASAVFLAFVPVLVFVGVDARRADAADTAYTVQDLGTLGGNLSRARDINESDQVVGETRIASGQLRAFLYRSGVMSDLGTFGGNSSRAFGVNDAGQVVGEARLTNGQLRAFLYENGQKTNLGTLLSTDTFSSASGVNSSGWVVGESGSATNQGHAFLYQDGQMKDLGTLGGTFSGAININDDGKIVGWAQNAKGQGSAFLYEDGQMKDLGTLPGGSYAEARDINESDQVVGTSKNASGNDTAFLYEDGQMKDLGTLGGPISNTHAINDFGQVVGWSPNAAGQGHAFIYEGGTMVDLNDRISAGSGWVLGDAFGINASGKIVGVGTRNAEMHAFLLTPNDTTSPSTTATLSPEPKADWNKEDVTVTLEATDKGGSNVEKITYSANGAQPIEGQTESGDTTKIEISAEGETTLTYYATDHAGNVEEPRTLTVRLDKTAPGVDITRPANGAEYKLGESVIADYACSDGGSGVDSCLGSVPVDGNVDTASIGQKTFTVEAGDIAGNVASKSLTYNVIYDFGGFLSPVDNPDVLNRARAGSAIPVKFSLGGDQGLNIFAEADGSSFPKSGPIPCDSADPVDAVEQTVSANSSGLTYDTATGLYTYVWKTRRDWTGCRQLVVKFDDGREYTANFKFFK